MLLNLIACQFLKFFCVCAEDKTIPTPRGRLSTWRRQQWNIFRAVKWSVSSFFAFLLSHRRALPGIQLEHKRDIMKSYIMKPALSVTNVALAESFDSSRNHTNRQTMCSVSSSKQSKLKQSKIKVIEAVSHTLHIAEQGQKAIFSKNVGFVFVTQQRGELCVF